MQLRVNSEARHEHQFVENYRQLNAALQALGVVKVRILFILATGTPLYLARAANEFVLDSSWTGSG